MPAPNPTPKSQDRPAAALLIVLAGTFFSVGIDAIMKGDLGRAVIPCILGLALFLSGSFWQSLKTTLGPRIAQTVTGVASDFRWWLAILLLLFLYLGSPRIMESIGSLLRHPGVEDGASVLITPVTPTSNPSALPTMVAVTPSSPVIETTTVASSPVPVKKYYPSRQKDEIVDGLQNIRKALGVLKTDLNDKAHKILIASQPMIRFGGHGLQIPGDITSENIANTIAAANEFDSLIRKISKKPVLGNEFLNDPTFSKEAAFVIDIPSYDSAYTNISYPITILLNNLNDLKFIFDVSKGSSQATGKAMIMINLLGTIGGLTQSNKFMETWIDDAIKRADKMEEALP